jgi:hypothetical protein
MCSSTFRRSSGISSVTEVTKVSFEAVMDPREGKTNAQSVKLLFAHDLVRKPVPTFRDHALRPMFDGPRSAGRGTLAPAEE